MAGALVVEDIFDNTYKKKQGPRPPMRLVWKNIILMILLHIGALYGLVLVPSASYLTLAWCKYIFENVAFLLICHSQRTECIDIV